jgi:hypothetical protein
MNSNVCDSIRNIVWNNVWCNVNFDVKKEIMVNVWDVLADFVLSDVRNFVLDEIREGE